MNVSNFFISNSYQLGAGTAFKILADSSSLDSGSFDSTGYAYLRVVCTWSGSNAATPTFTFSGDTSASYNWRISTNGAADTTGTADNNVNCSQANESSGGIFTLDVNNDPSSYRHFSGTCVREEDQHTRIGGRLAKTALISQFTMTLASAANTRTLVLGI